MNDEERAEIFFEDVRAEIDPAVRVKMLWMENDVMFSYTTPPAPRGSGGRLTATVDVRVGNMMTLAPYFEKHDRPDEWEHVVRQVADTIWETMRSRLEKGRLENERARKVGELEEIMRARVNEAYRLTGGTMPLSPAEASSRAVDEFRKLGVTAEEINKLLSTRIAGVREGGKS